MANNKQNKKALSPRLAFGFLTGLGVVTLLFGFVSLSQSIRQPLVAQQAREAELGTADEADLSRILDDSAQAQLRLRNRDTDLDGLSDYDELYVYTTSPYLPDSDSDGFSDRDEIESNNDPNCPQGQNCRSPLDELGASELNDGLFGDILPPVEEPVSDIETELPDLTNLSAAELRELLIETGQISQEQLDQIDDETLLQAYGNVVGETDN